MLRSAAITDIKSGLGFRSTQDTVIIRRLQEAQRELEQGSTLPDFLISYDNAITVTADDPSIVLPTRFIRFHDDYDAYYVNSYDKRVFIPRRNYSEAYAAYIGPGTDDDTTPIETASTGYPSVIVQRSKSAAILIPTPTVSFTMYLTCYVGAVVLDAEVENAWLANAPDVLIGLAGTWVASNLRDKDALATFTQRYKMGRANVLADKIEDELAGRALIMGRNN